MNALLEQINSIGKGFVEFAWPMLVQSSVLIVILLLVDFVLRKRVRAVFRYCIWMLVLVKLVLPSSLSSPLSFGYLFGDSLENVTVSRMTTTAEAVEMPLPMEVAGGGEARSVEAISMAPIAAPTTGGIEPAVEAAGLPATSMAQVTWQGVVFLVWLAVVGAMVLLLLQRALFVRGLVAQAKNANSLMNDAFRYCCGQMGMKRKVGLKVSANATSPAVCGLFRPVILVPQNLGPSLGSSHLRTVLLHELAHIKRRDLWVNLVQTVLQIIYFYNPLLWLANAVIRKVREQAVDETVQVAMGERAQQYPETLVNVAKLAFRRPALSLRLIGVVESESALKGRIKRMLSRPIPRSAKLGILGLAAVLIIGAVLIPMAAFTPGAPELVIKGMVKDAQTGEPIGGARVFDDGYGPMPSWGEIQADERSKWGAVTNSAGEYSFLTWPEHHSIRVEAPGYEAKRETLYDGHFTFNKKDEEVFDFELVPHNSGFIATLSNGVEVELVGVCEHPSEGKQWWRPDGSLLNETPYKTTGSLLPEHANYRYCEFVIRLQDTDDISVKWDVPGGRQGSFTGNPMGANGQRISDLQVYTVNQPEDKKTALVRIGLSTARWQTIATHPVEIPEETYSIDEDGAVAFGRSYEKDSKTVIPITHNINRGREKKALRVVAVTYSGREVRGSVSGRGGNILSSNTHEFNLTLRDIKEFRFQTRPYEWVEFRNVSLRPGVKSDVEIEVGKVEVREPGAKWFGELLKKAVTVNVDHSPDDDRPSVQYAVIAVCEAAGVPYKWEKSARLADPERRRFIESVHVKRVTGAKALEDILKPVGLRYGLDDEGLYIYRSTDSQKLGEKTEAEKEGKDGKGEILARLRALDEQRERVQRELDYAERALQDVRVASGRTDLEERSYPHPVTSRLNRLELERDNCVLEIAQLKAKIENLHHRGAAEELENATDNLAMLEGKLKALDRMRAEAEARKRDFDRARVEYKRRLAIRDERQRMLGSLKGQIEQLRMIYDKVEASEEQLEVERALTEKEGKDWITAKLRALDEQRNRVQGELGNAERGLQDVRARWGFTDLEERGYPHPVTERLMRLEQERDNCVLEIAQLKANIANLLKQPDSPEGKEKLKKVKDNLTVSEGKLKALDKLIKEAKERKRDLDLARVQYKRRARIRDERQVMLDSLKAQIEKLRIAYNEAERAKEDVETKKF